jgi:cobalt/nickel transport system permease protein
MIGHLTIAGLAEMVISGGVVAYLQRAEPRLLEATSGGTVGWRATRPLWAALAILMLLTPLGVLAAGTAWGEWTPGPGAPQGMRRLAAFWTAPIPQYAPSFLHSAGLGYVLSAMAGTGLIILAVLIAGRLTRGRSQ